MFLFLKKRNILGYPGSGPLSRHWHQKAIFNRPLTGCNFATTEPILIIFSAVNSILSELLISDDHKFAIGSQFVTLSGSVLALETLIIIIRVQMSLSGCTLIIIIRGISQASGIAVSSNPVAPKSHLGRDLARNSVTTHEPIIRVKLLTMSCKVLSVFEYL